MSGRPTRRAAAARRAAIIESDDEDKIANTTIKRQDSDEEEYTLPVEEAPAPRRRTTAGRRKTAASVANTSVASTSTITTTTRRGRPRKSAAPIVASSVEPSVLPDETGEPSEAVDPDQSTSTVIHNPAEEEEPTIKVEESTKKPAPRRGKKGAPPRKKAKIEEVQEVQDISEVPEAPEAPVAPEVSEVPEAEAETEDTQLTPKASRASPAPSQASRVLKASQSPAPSQARGTPLADITNQSAASPRGTNDETVTEFKPIKAMDTILEKPMDIVLKSRAQMTMPVVIEDTGPKPRIVITYLILNNFKSYAGRQEVGPFHASFSSVVGPNGSGKSNVIDSLLFVFGFRASKMRQGKISALIHNSAQYPSLDHCEVAVHFQEVMDLVRYCPSQDPFSREAY
jgi:structural maintenance of chromosome 4